MASNKLSRSQKLLDLCQRFSQSTAKSNQSQLLKTPNKAVVLICLFEEEDDIYVILTKRSSKLSSYSGEISLLGGRTNDQNVDYIQTALREAEEEIGLNPALVDVVTVLQPIVSKGNETVVPVIGILWDKQAFSPVLDAEEVESVFYAPIEMFLKDDNQREEEKEFQGDEDLYHYFDHKRNDKVYVNVIHPLTADILLKTALMVYHPSPNLEPMMPKICNRLHSRL